MLRQVLDVMRQGKATLIAPQDLRLTTQEAADFLGVSRPTVVKLPHRREAAGGRRDSVRAAGQGRYWA